MYNYKLKTDGNILKNEDNIENRETGEAPILKEEVKWIKKNTNVDEWYTDLA